MAPSTSKSVTELDDIPTLHDLYASDELTPSSKEQEDGDEREYRSAEELNKRVSIWRGKLFGLELVENQLMPSGDITVLKAGMIVNAANSSLLGGGGVDGAIHRAAGRKLLAECEGLGGAETGETKVTGAYNLPSTWIAHTVGPIYSSSRPEQSKKELESCYGTSLEHCKEKEAESIGFSSISTGVYGYPIEDATHVALRQTRLFLEAESSVKRVVYVVFSAKDERVYRSLAPIYFPPLTSVEREASPTGTAVADEEPKAVEDPASAAGETPSEQTAEVRAESGEPVQAEAREESSKLAAKEA